MNLLNKLFKKKEKPTCLECIKKFLDDEPSLYPKILVKPLRTDKVQNDSIVWICKDLKRGIKIEKILNRPQVPIKKQIRDICKFYEYLESEHPSSEDEDIFINKLINDQEEQNNDQN